MKEIVCPNCGKVMVTLRIGRRATNIGVTNICDALQTNRSIQAAAESLGCSRGLIYKVLKQHGMTPAGVIKEHATKDNRLLHNGGSNDRQ